MPSSSLSIAVIGGGINGLCTALELADRGHSVRLFERGALMDQTSSRSSKLLHGGLRYLETGSFRLVYESLQERSRWLADCPEHAQPLRIALPIVRGVSRSPWALGAGLFLYRALAGTRNIGGSPRWCGARRFARENPELADTGLRGGFYFHDGRMDDRALGLWVAERARAAGVHIEENCEVERMAPDGALIAGGSEQRFDLIVNAAGPWAAALLERSGLRPHWGIDWVRGSHIVFDEPLRQACMLQVPGERRIVFVLPWQGRTMVGTTEVVQATDTPIVTSREEIDYLLAVHNRYFRRQRSHAEIGSSFSGVRPLLRFSGDPTRASREYALAQDERLLTIYGGKWTTARALARHVAERIRTPAASRR